MKIPVFASILWLSSIGSCQSCDVLGPFSAATNFAVNLLGNPDFRPETWGRAEAVTWHLRFFPPPGYRVRILRVYGDLLIWPRGTVEPGKFAGVLLGLQSTAAEGSKRCDLCADNTFLYIQSATGGRSERASFDYRTYDGGLLSTDNVLVVKIAVWLNDTDRAIHIEPTFVLVYQFEREELCQQTN